MQSWAALTSSLFLSLSMAGCLPSIPMISHSRPESLTSLKVLNNTTRTFLQLWNNECQELSQGQWIARFEEVGKLGFDEVIVQWSSYLQDGSVYDYSLAEASGPSCISRVLAAALATDLTVYMGLEYDAGYWNRVDPGVSEVAVKEYLRGREKRLAELAKRVAPLIDEFVATGGTFGGWYISDELEDNSWNDDERRTLIGDYVTNVTSLLASASPEGSAPVLLSAYATGKQSPVEYGKFLSEIANRGGIHQILFQDGVGAGNISLSQFKAYGESAAIELGDRLAPITEVFERDGKGGFRPAPFEVAIERLSIAYTIQPEVTGTVFAAFPYLEGQENKLRQEWLAVRKAAPD